MTWNLRISVKRIRVTTAITLVMLLAVGLSFVSLPVQADFAPDLQDQYWNGDIQPKYKLDDLIDVMADNETADIVVLYGPGVISEDCDLSDAANFLSAYGEVGYVARYIHAIAVSNVLVRDIKSEILPSPNIFRIEKQPTFHVALDVSARAVKARGSTTYSPGTAFDRGYQGYGINIAIIDTGVDDGHESLAGKFVAGYNAFTNTEMNPDDDYSPVFHGTHCAGIAMGTGGASGTYMGVAPEAKLIDIKVLDSSGSGTWTSVTKGIEWAIANRARDWPGQPPEYDGIDVLSLSLSASGSSNGNDALSILVDEAVSAGLVVVIAAGNDGDVGYISTPGSADRAITVGAINDQSTVDRSDDVRPTFSQTGPRADDGDADHVDEMKPDVAAPGVNIMSARGITPGQNGVGYQQLSGTSMACPHVAGIAALILQYGETVGGYTPDMVKTFLRNTAEDRDGTYNSAWDPTWDKNYGKGIVDAYAAIPVSLITDLGFQPGSCPTCGQTGGKVCWPGTSVIYLDAVPKVGVLNKIHAVVSNYGPANAPGATVIFSYARTGIGNWVFSEIARTTIGTISSGGTAIATVDWTPQFAEHECIRAEVVYSDDNNLENNVGQVNYNVQQTSSPAALKFMIVNPFPVAKEIVLVVNKTDLPPGWTTLLSSDRGIFNATNEAASFPMGGDACPEYLTLTTTPRQGAVDTERGAVTIKMYIDEGFIGEQTFVAVVSKPVGGIIELPQIEEPGIAIPDSSGHNYALLAAIVAGAVIGIIGTAWYIRRRRTKAT